MSDTLIQAAGPTPARDEGARWRQVALLGLAAAAGAGGEAQLALATTLLALDHPQEAEQVAAAVGDDDPWASWLRVLAIGQRAAPDVLRGALESARMAAHAGPTGGEVARRLDDLADELAALRGDDPDLGRFALLGYDGGEPRRALVVGRSSAEFVVAPSWDDVVLIRLGPYSGRAAGNRAHDPLERVIGEIRRGSSGPGRPVPGDAPRTLVPAAMLTALRADANVRDRQLLKLAEEVRAERLRLADQRDALEDAKAELIAEKAQLRRSAGNGRPAPRALPSTPSQAAELLGLGPNPTRAQIEAAWRDQVRRCHPDRVAGLHAGLVREAEGLTVALNAARDLLLRRAA